MGVSFDIEIQERGYYPRGGGQVLLQVSPVKKIEPINLSSPASYKKSQLILHVDSTIQYEKQKIWLTKAKKIFNILLPNSKNLPKEVQTLFMPKSEKKDHCAWIEFCAITDQNLCISYSCILDKGKFRDEVVSEAMNRLANTMEKLCSVDEYLQDQLVIYMALADGESCLRCHVISDHTKSAIYTAEKLTTAKFKIEQCVEDGSFLLKCTGVARRNELIIE